MVKAQDIAVVLGRKQAVAGVSFTACPGTLTAVIGPNGSGKTTLLRALSGDLRFKGHAAIGELSVAGAPAWRMAAIRAVLPQASALSFPFTVREVVAIGLSAGIAVADPALRVEEALARVDLDGFAGRFYQELSGGEQQRVQLARVLCQVWEPLLDGVPRWLFLDEPVSSLDIRHQLAIMDIARDFARGGGGVIAVLHDLNLTCLYADQVLVMNEGRLLAAGPPAAIVDDALLERAFGCPLRVGVLPRAGVPFVLPQSVSAAAGSRHD